MPTPDRAPGEQPGPPPAQPWSGGATGRPPWEKDPETTHRIPPVQPPQVQQPPPAQQPTSGPQPQPQPPAQPAPPGQQPPRVQPQQVPQHPAQPPTPSGATPAKPSALTGRAPHGDSAARRLTRTVVRAFSSTKKPRELEEILAAVQAPITTGRRIAVTSACGGAGKTAIAAMLGSVFATRRAEPVLAVEAATTPGSLAWRFGLEPAQALPGLAPALRTASGQNLPSVDRLLPRTSQGLWVVPGNPEPQLARDVTRALSRLFAVSVLDCATGITDPSSAPVLADAHVVVVVAPATPDGVRITADELARVATTERQHVVVALNTVDGQGRRTLDSAAARGLLSQLGVAVVPLPYDRHIAAGGRLEPDRLAEPTVTAASALAAWSLRQAKAR